MMNKIKDMKVQKKLKTCFTMITLMASFSGVLGLIILLYSNSRYSTALVDNGFSQGEIGIFSTYLGKEPSLIRELILVTDQESMDTINSELDQISANTNESYEVVKKHCNTAAEKEYIAVIDEKLPDYREIFQEVKELASKNQNEEALDMLLNEGKPTLKEITNAVEGLIDINVEMGNDVSGSLKIQTYVSIGIMILLIILVSFIAMRFAAMIAKMFADPIIKIQEATQELSKGNLNVHVDKLYPDEIGDMTDAFNSAIGTLNEYVTELVRVFDAISAGDFTVTSQVDFMGDFEPLDTAIVAITNSLSKTLGNIYEASGQVSMGAGQMAESAQSLAEGATDQAASVQQLTATIQDITENVIHSSEKANQSHRDAETFKRDAEESNEDIKHLNTAMERINETSKEIANIIAAIEDIASQTNLLSLNASIEAARAGEAGKGFAVVADQIGKLATDSGTAAIDTKRLIENSLQEIEHGNEITIKATAAIESVIKGINSLAESTNEISQLSDSQAEAMKQLEAGVEQISEVIQNNSAAAQQTSATSEQLSAQSEGLEQLVGQFTLKE